MTTPATHHAVLRQTEPSPAARLRQQATELMRLADELDGIALAGAPERAADHVEAMADHKPVVDAPTPGDMVALKVAAHRWRRSERNLKKIAADHGALHKIGGRNMIDNAKLTAAIFGRL